MTDNAKPDVEELYTMANNASNLLVIADRNGAGDLLIAAGWSPSRLGAAMLRLHSEWDAAAKPSKPTPAEIDALALTTRREDGKPNRPAAYELATSWYQCELVGLLGKLHSLRIVRDQVAIQADRWRMADPEAIAAAVVKYWLDQSCHPCAGLRFRPIVGAPALSNRLCPSCQGSGLAQVPHGPDGKRLANYMDDCVNRARVSIRQRLRPVKQV